MNIFRNQYPSLALLLQYFVTVVVRSQSASIDVLSTSLVSSSSSVIPTPNDSLSSNDASYISIPATSVAVCTVLIVLAIIILVLLVKKTKRRVIIIRPPDVENPHYNNLTILSESVGGRFSLKRLSWKLRSYRSSQTADDMQIKHLSVPSDVNVSLPTITSSHSTNHLQIHLSSQEQNHLITQESPLPSTPSLDSSRDEGICQENKSSLSKYGDNDPEAYEIPGGYTLGSTPIRLYSKLNVPVYSVLYEDGFLVPSEDERESSNSSSECFVQQIHSYNKLQFFEQSDKYWLPVETKNGLYTQLSAKKYREIPQEKIQITEQLGSGNFGSVYKGVWNFQDRCLDIAVKILKTGSSSVDKVKFLQEAAIMGQFFHPNIVRLHGVVTVGEPNMIVLELLANGDLLTYLRRLSPTPDPREQDPLQRLFLKFARQIASGMEYLSKKCFVHRDLAARNILLNHELTCKIGDFGMARDLIDEYYKSKGGKIPIKWTAPEALLYNKYSTDSDVWSYGILLYEIWSLGNKPFAGFSNSDMVSLAFTGLCHPPSFGLPKAIYTLMINCWNPEHSKRPKFDKISLYLSQSNSELLHWSDSDLSVSPLVHIIGVSQQDISELYKNLQHTYKQVLLVNKERRFSGSPHLNRTRNNKIRGSNTSITSAPDSGRDSTVSFHSSVSSYHDDQRIGSKASLLS